MVVPKNVQFALCFVANCSLVILVTLFRVVWMGIKEHLHGRWISTTKQFITWNCTKNASYSGKLPWFSHQTSEIVQLIMFQKRFIHIIIIRHIFKYCNTSHVFNKKTGELSRIWSSRRAINSLVATIQRPCRSVLCHQKYILRSVCPKSFYLI